MTDGTVWAFDGRCCKTARDRRGRGVLRAAPRVWGALLVIGIKNAVGLRLRTIVLGCLAAGAMAILVGARPWIADDRSAPEVQAPPQPRLPRDNLLVFRGPDN